MNRLCDKNPVRLSYRDMVRVVCIILLFIASRVVGQIPASSPALDPDFVILQPKEEFTGAYANQTVGAVIHTVAPLNWKIPQGVVFLNNVDTAGYSGNFLEDNQPTGLFFQEQSFSLFNRAFYLINGIVNPAMVFTRGENEYPVMATSTSFGPIFFYFPNDTGKFIDTFRYEPYIEGAFTLGSGRAAYAKANLDGDLFDDLIALETSKEGSGDKTHIGIWYDEDIVYRDEKWFDVPIIKASVSFTVDYQYTTPGRRGMHAADFDEDGVMDFCYWGGSLTGGKKNGLTFVFGKSVANKWEMDTIYSIVDSSYKNFLFMDYLYEDGIADLLLSTEDTIFCFSGHKSSFLRNAIDFSDADFKIPSPASIDPVNFGTPEKAYGFGDYMYDAGNINGSGVHSIATSPGKFMGGLNSIPYLIIYSGGKAADAKVDAIWAQPAGTYNGCCNLDTVNVGSSPTGIIAGDPGHTAGTNGKIWYFLGDKSIPHKPNPQWKVEHNYKFDITLQTRAFQNALEIAVVTDAYSEGTLAIRDILGRIVYRQNLYYEIGNERTLKVSTTNFSEGIYIISYEQDHQTVIKKVFIHH